MKKLKLRTKLIVINCILLTIMIVSQYLFQNVFLERNYKSYKKQQVIESLDTYETYKASLSSFKKYKKDLLDTQSIIMFKMDKNFENIVDEKVENDYIIIQDAAGQRIKLQVLLTKELFDTIRIGDEIEAEVLDSKGTLIAGEITVKRDKKIIFQTQMSNIEIYAHDLQDIKDIPVKLKIKSDSKKGTLVDFKRNENPIEQYYQIIQYYLKTHDVQISDHTLEYITYNRDPYLFGVRPSSKGYVISITSMKIPKDLVNMFNEFSRYLILTSVIILGLLVVLYEKIITKPIIKINEASKQIAKQRFDVGLQIQTGDELEELSQAVNEIAKNLDQRIQDLKVANEQLSNEYKERIQIEKNQKFLLMNISHDLKTPLTVIKGNLQAIKDGVYDVEKHIQPTIDGVDEITQTLNEMLELTKLQNPQLKLNKELCDFTRIVYQIYDRIKRLAKDKHIEVLFDMENDAFVHVDQKEMKRVVENLMVNGIKYSPKNAHIYITLKEQQNKYIWIIENTGIHIDEKEIDLLFKKFYRKDKSRNSKERGNGLGLTIVKTILERHNLAYRFENTTKGMQFTIELEQWKFDI